MTHADDERIWYRVDLTIAAALVDEYRLWKDGPWYGRVDWQRITTGVDEVLQRCCRDGSVSWDELMIHIEPIERRMRKTDREGLASLLLYPIEVTREQLHNGGHRLTAMLAQNVRFVPGCCMRGDIGDGIDASQVYPCMTPPEPLLRGDHPFAVELGAEVGRSLDTQEHLCVEGKVGRRPAFPRGLPGHAGGPADLCP